MCRSRAARKRQNAAVSGQVEAVCDAITVIQPQAKAGRLKTIALAAEKRNSAASDVPTSPEQGVAAFQVGSWNALLGPVGLGADKVDVLNKALAKAMAKSTVRARLTEMGIEPMPLGTKAYAEHVATETVKWEKVVKAAGTRLD